MRNLNIAPTIRPTYEPGDLDNLKKTIDGLIILNERKYLATRLVDGGQETVQAKVTYDTNSHCINIFLKPDPQLDLASGIRVNVRDGAGLETLCAHISGDKQDLVISFTAKVEANKSEYNIFNYAIFVPLVNPKQ